ncbi:MAG: carboxypeptidase regulatory-like domain-containing protein [Blastocatellia bacterium]
MTPVFRLCLYSMRALSLAALFMLLLSAPGFAQTATGGIRGAVTDSTDAAVPNAAVVARNPATGVELKTTTNGEGVYSLPRILPGSYNVMIEAAGFKKSELRDITVSAGKDSVVDTRLETGAISDVVTIAGGAEALVEKDTVQISTSFQQKKIQELPISAPGTAGGLDRIAFLAPGVTQGFGNVNANGVTLSVNGNRARSNNFTIDGVDNNDLSIGGPSFNMRNPELVSEIQVVTSNFSAEFGRNQGAIVNYVSRSGSNDYHGRIFYDRLDNANWNTRTNLEKRQNALNPNAFKKPVQNFANIFGFTVGGPVMIPKFGEGGKALVDGRNRLFFFTSGFFQRNPGAVFLQSTGLAPTPAGIALLKSNFAGNAAIQYLANFGPFALPLGNPTVRPDIAPVNVDIAGVSIPVAAPQRTVSTPNPLNEYTLRMDGNAADKHRFWGRLFRQKQPLPDAGRNVAGFTYDNPAFARQLGGGWTWTISNRLVNEFRINYSRFFVLFGGGGSGGPGNIPGIENLDKALTNMNIGGITAGGRSLISIGPATNLPQGRDVKAYQYNDTLSITLGNHQLKTGFDFRKLDNFAPFLPNVNGSFLFSNLTELSTNNPTNLTVALGPSDLTYGEKDQYYFFQDDWRIRPNLTLNLGVRYENTGQPINLLNDLTLKRESAASGAFWRQNLPIEARTIPRVPVDNNNIAPRVGFVYSPQYNGGFMGKLVGDKKTTVRGGYSVAYEASFYNLLLNISTSAPTVFSTTVVGPRVPGGTPTGDVVRNAAIQANVIRFNAFDPRLLNRTLPSAGFKAPYSQQWSLGIQREFGRNVFEVRYVGTKGTGIFQTINANPFIGNLVNGFSRPYFNPATNAAASLTFPGFASKLGVNATPLTCTDNPATVGENEGACNGRLLPVGTIRERINGVKSIYHGLQSRFDSRLANQLTLGASYTWSHAIDNSSEVFSFAGGNSVAVSQNPLDLTRAERGNSGFDARHVFTTNFLWEVPWMKEQKGLVGRVLGGWQVNGILLVQAGRPFTPIQNLASRNPYEDGGYMAGFFGGASHFRPFAGNPTAATSRVGITDVDACIFYALCGASGGNPILRPSSTGYYLLNDLNTSTAANRVYTTVTPNDVRFIVNGPGAAQRFGTPFGNVGRNTFVGDRNENLDLSFFKNIRITERVTLQYRLQMINALNHPFFGIPNTISLDTAGTTFFNYQENDGGRRTLSMGLRLSF